MFSEFVNQIVQIPQKYMDTFKTRNGGRLDFTVNMTHAVCVPEGTDVQYMYLTMRDDKPNDLVSYFNRYDGCSCLAFIDFKGFPSMDSIATYEQNGYKALSDVKEFFWSTNNKIVFPFVNEERKITFVFLEDDTTSVHLALSVLPRLLPWLGITLDEEKQQYLTALQAESYGVWCVLAKKYAQDHRFAAMIVEQKFQSMVDKIYKAQIPKFEREINELNRRYNDTLDDLSVIARKIRTAQENLYMQKYNKDKDILGMQQLKDYLVNAGDKVEIRDIDESSGEFVLLVKTYLSNWPVECIDAILDNEDSYMYYDKADENNYDTEFDSDFSKVRKFWEAIFINETIKVRFYSKFSLDMFNFKVNVYSKSSTSLCLDNSICNPHHYRFTCLGDWKTRIIEEMRHGTITDVINLCVASAGSLNIEESPTMEYFTHYIFKCLGNERVFENAQTGVSMTFAEAYEFAQTA